MVWERLFSTFLEIIFQHILWMPSRIKRKQTQIKTIFQNQINIRNLKLFSKTKLTLQI